VELVEEVVQQIPEAEMKEALEAEKGERTAQRRGYQSGYYQRTLITRVGKLELRVRTGRGTSGRSCSSVTSGARKRWWGRWRRCMCKGFRHAR
jgi:Transposase, Mutator family